MKTYIPGVSLIFLLILPAAGVYGQHQHHHHSGEPDSAPEVVQFLDEIRKITAKYHDIEAAKRDGYVQFGPDMPNMGKHFVYPGKAVSRDFRLNRPPVLTYLPVDGEYLFTGVAYTYPVGPNDQPPELPFEEVTWHFHSGEMEKEAYGIHLKEEMFAENSKIMRLGMIHAWIWSDNPDGLFSADHWGLSYKRLGVESPPHPDVDASRALFMLFGGVEYYTRFTELAAAPDDEKLEAVQVILEQYRDKIKPAARQISERQKVTNDDQKKLKQLWNNMWMEIQMELDAKTWGHIEPYLAGTHDH